MQESVLKYGWMPFVWIIWLTFATKLALKLIRPLDFHLCVSTTVLVDSSLPFAFQRQRVSFIGSQLHFTVVLVFKRIKQDVYGLAQSITLIKSQVQVSKRQRCILLCVHG